MYTLFFLYVQGIQVDKVKGSLEMKNVSFAYQMRPSHMVNPFEILYEGGGA